MEAYLSFPGTCEEAFEFYKGVFGGEVTFNRFSGSPMEADVPADFATKIMHAHLHGPYGILMGSDQSGTLDEPSRISLSVTVKDDEASHLFERLGDGGSVVMPIGDVFWGGKFGMLKDRYGFTWMLSTAS